MSDTRIDTIILEIHLANHRDGDGCVVESGVLEIAQRGITAALEQDWADDAEQVVCGKIMYPRPGGYSYEGDWRIEAC
jgi:hypothetical protein